MITNPDARTVLCFGDSNTYGERPDSLELGRLPIDQRWTGMLQQILGDQYSVIDEGLNGRTTDIDYAERTGCNGRTYLQPCLKSHAPLDIAVIMLGTNDLKSEFKRSAQDIAAAIGRLLGDIKEFVAPSQTIVVSPLHIDGTQPDFEEMCPEFDAASIANSRALGALLRQVAADHGTAFADAATVVAAGADGLHLSYSSHAKLAALLAETIQAL